MSDFEKLINASDLIDWIIEIDPEWCIGTVRSIVDHIEEMPSAQPEIVRCRECRHWDTGKNCGYCDIWDHYISNEAFYCACGERRE